LRKREEGYFKVIPGAPEPVTLEVKRRVSFNEVDVMGIVWYGRYSIFFEEAQAKLGRHCGLSYQDYYNAQVRAPIVQFHVDYFQPLYLDEEFSVQASMIWSEGARLNMEYAIVKADGSIATRAYTVQMFIDSNTSEPYIASPQMFEDLRKRWLRGEFKCLK
jgi:acyl-CoA thioester hydrolase